MDYKACPKCGGRVTTEKDSSSGRVMREYYCPACKWSTYDDEGEALWQTLERYNEEASAEKAKAPPPPQSWLARLKRRLGL